MSLMGASSQRVKCLYPVRRSRPASRDMSCEKVPAAGVGPPQTQAGRGLRSNRSGRLR
ncbi:hypothetical protein [Lysobacter gummosus]|uniref:hypothetical protein n=1 Tax=Lysobacter gummosus TaxID=262324 RepID=UPI003634E22F